MFLCVSVITRPLLLLLEQFPGLRVLNLLRAQPLAGLLPDLLSLLLVLGLLLSFGPVHLSGSPLLLPDQLS